MMEEKLVELKVGTTLVEVGGEKKLVMVLEPSGTATTAWCL